jgi:hypothetical protein
VRLAISLTLLALSAGLLIGCGSSDQGTSPGSTAPPQTDGAQAPAGASTESCPLNAGGATGLRASGVSCGKAQKIAITWGRSSACTGEPDASRTSCTVGSYRCLGTRTAAGLAVSCSRPGRAIAFTAKS